VLPHIREQSWFTYLFVCSFFDDDDDDDDDSNSGYTASKGTSTMDNKFERMRKEVVMAHLR
jgi:hypothetical protein